MAKAPDQLADDQSIADEVWVLRRVHPDIARSGRPDSSLFKAGKEGIGTSVTLARGPEDLEIIRKGHDVHGVVAISVGAFRRHGLGINYTFEEGNPNHCEVFGARGRAALRELSAEAQWVVRPDGIGEELIPDLFDPFEPTAV